MRLREIGRFYRECVAPILRTTTYESNNETISHNLKRARRTYRIDCAKIAKTIATRERTLANEDTVTADDNSFKLYAYPSGKI